MEMRSATIRVVDRSNVAEVRRAARHHAERLGFKERDRGDCEIVASELATNIVKHAKDGVVAVTSSTERAHGVVQVVAVDRGPGLADIERCFVDGYSTAGSPGTGLGAVRRLSSSVDVVSAPEGTVVVAELRRTVAPSSGEPDGLAAFRIGAFELAKEGQVVSGDGWAARAVGTAVAVLACDGLGHGEAAHEATRRALGSFLEARWTSPKEMLTTIHAALRATRGAAAAVALIDPSRSCVTYAGIGNIAAGLVEEDRTRHLVSMNGIVGNNVYRIKEFEYPWASGSTLVLHTDGISARWPETRWAGLWRRHPALIAAAMYRDCGRGNDDVLAVVVVEK